MMPIPTGAGRAAYLLHKAAMAAATAIAMAAALILVTGCDNRPGQPRRPERPGSPAIPKPETRPTSTPGAHLPKITPSGIDIPS